MKSVFLLIFAICFSTGCARTHSGEIFGVRRDVWHGLGGEEKRQVIASYHQLEQQKLDNQRRQQEIESNTAPIRIVAGAIENIVDAANKKKAKR